MKENLPPQDLQLLSSYLDRELSPAEQMQLEKRLQHEPGLVAELSDLRKIWFLLRSQPRLKAPRNYYLTADMVGARKAPAAYPVLKMVSAFAAILLIVVVAGDLWRSTGTMQANLSDSARQMEAAPAEAFQVGEAATVAEAPAAMQAQATMPPDEAGVAVSPKAAAPEPTGEALAQEAAPALETAPMPKPVPAEGEQPGASTALAAIRARIGQLYEVNLDLVRVLEGTLLLLVIGAGIGALWTKRRR